MVFSEGLALRAQGFFARLKMREGGRPRESRKGSAWLESSETF